MEVERIHLKATENEKNEMKNEKKQFDDNVIKDIRNPFRLKK